MASSKLTVQNRWDNEPKNVLVERIQFLEEEVKLLKTRMDELRKAKNQTIIKREHEFVEVGNPISEKDIQTSARCRELEEKISKLRREHADQLSKLREEKDQEIAKLSESVIKVRNEVQHGPCGHEDELRQLRTKISVLENDNSSAKTELETQKDTIDGLWYQLSVKEAEWCDKEEKMMYQFQKTFQTVQEGLSEKVAQQLQARIAEVWRDSGAEPDLDENVANEQTDKATKSTSDSKK